MNAAKHIFSIQLFELEFLPRMLYRRKEAKAKKPAS
jgi:hypothetical protein